MFLSSPSRKYLSIIILIFVKKFHDSHHSGDSSDSCGARVHSKEHHKQYKAYVLAACQPYVVQGQHYVERALALALHKEQQLDRLTLIVTSGSIVTADLIFVNISGIYYLSRIHRRNSLQLPIYRPLRDANLPRSKHNRVAAHHQLDNLCLAFCRPNWAMVACAG